VNKELASLGTKAELAKGAGYFLFRGGEAEEWIDRTVRVRTIGSLTLEEWLNEYKRLKTLNGEMLNAAEQAPPKPAKKEKERDATPAHSAPTRATPHPTPPHAPQTRPEPTDASLLREAPPSESPPRSSARKEVCDLKAKLLADVEQAHTALLDIEKKEVGAARDGQVSDLVTLSAAATRERSKFDRALLAIRDHIVLHGC
jgi:hypothetical protein